MVPKYRTQMAMIIDPVSCGIGIMMVSLIGYIFSTWVTYYIALASIMVIIMPIIMAMPRNYRWYFSQGYVGLMCRLYVDIIFKQDW